MKRDIKKERFEEFLAEAEDILGSMGRDLIRLEKDMKAGAVDVTVINDIFRSAHTLKGMAAIFSFSEMSSLSHSMEDMLDSLRMGKVSLTEDVLDCIMRTHDLLLKMISSRREKDLSREIRRLRRELDKCRRSNHRNAGHHIPGRLASALTEYEEHRLGENLRQGIPVFVINAAFPVKNFDSGYMALTEELKKRGEVIATLPSGEDDPGRLSFDLIFAASKDGSSPESFLNGIDGIKVKTLATHGGRAGKRSTVQGRRRTSGRRLYPGESETYRSVSNTVRVDIGKLDKIMSIVGELSALKSTLSSLNLKSGHHFYSYGVELAMVEKQFEKKIDDLRDSILGVRMVPIGQLFGRFETLLSRLSRESGKELKMATYGEDTELDKLIVEELADPLMHIIRNTVDHGIETPEERARLGKPREGTLTMSAHQKGSHVVLEVKDDGRGIDIEAVRSTALRKGLVTEEFLDGLDDRGILDLIFLPGFSTKDFVSEVSGRGVGMDVVKQNITKLSGVIDIKTVKGKGASFILTIPVTLAIIQALIVEDGGARYAVPLNSVIEVTEIPPSDMKAIELSEETTVHGRTMPTIRLSGFLGKGSSQRRGQSSYGIVAGLAEHRLCIIVDHLVEEQDVVIKPLSRLFRVPGIAGAADLGEKGTILVIDVTGVLELVLKERKAVASA